jgi:hypothetical protein
MTEEEQERTESILSAMSDVVQGHETKDVVGAALWLAFLVVYRALDDREAAIGYLMERLMSLGAIVAPESVSMRIVQPEKKGGYRGNKKVN